MSVILDQAEHPAHGKGRPSCRTCRGAGVVVVADNARGRAAGLKFPGAFKCACVDSYQAKIRRRARRGADARAAADDVAAQRQARELEHLAQLAGDVDQVDQVDEDRA